MMANPRDVSCASLAEVATNLRGWIPAILEGVAPEDVAI